MKMNKIAFAVAVAMAAIPATQANAATLVINVAGAQSFSTFGTAGNQFATYFLGANAHITNVSYNVTIEAFSPSYLSEAGFGFTDSAPFTDGVLLRPGVGVDAAGIGTYSNSVDLIANSLDFFLKADGVLRTEFYDAFNDSAVSPDAIWRSGTITITYNAGATGAVPEPATWAMMIVGFGLVGGAMRRRTKLTVRYAA